MNVKEDNFFLNSVFLDIFSLKIPKKGVQVQCNLARWKQSTATLKTDED